MRLNQIIAVEKSVKTRTNNRVTKAYQLAQKGAIFAGGLKEFLPSSESDEELPPESKRVECTVDELIGIVKESSGELWDTAATKDFANCTACADVVVDGKVLISEAPVTFLLFLEKQLTDLHTFVKSLPTLDPAMDWHWDDVRSLYKTEPRKTARTKKVQKPIVLYDATDKHPAQTQLISDDIVSGYWSTVLFSGAITKEKQRVMLRRVEELQKAVKYAREQGNETDAPQRRVGAHILDWVFEGCGAS